MVARPFEVVCLLCSRYVVFLHRQRRERVESEQYKHLLLRKGSRKRTNQTNTNSTPQVFGTAPDHPATSKLPQHGFARTSRWEFLGKSTSESGETKDGGDNSVKLDFGLSSNNLSEESKKAWPFDFGLIYSVTLGKDSLTTSIVVQNAGEKAWEFQTLLHTYLKVKVR